MPRLLPSLSTPPLALLCAISSIPDTCHAQTAPMLGQFVHYSLQSGSHGNPSQVEGVVWRDFVTLPAGTPWLRLYFERANLGDGSYLRIVSLRDGDVMTMHQQHMLEWSNSSAYFNGNSVMVEIVAGPGTVANEIAITRVFAGDITPVYPIPETICGATDDRLPSTDARIGRIDPVGCTGWIINLPANGVDKCHLSAGHCARSGEVLEFGVPGSAANCGLAHPPASRQFAIDFANSRSANGGFGNDYWVFRCFRNPVTNLTTFQTQGAAFDLAAAMPAVNSTVRVTGYGIDGTVANNAPGANGSCTCTAANNTGQRNQIQQTHTGAATAFTATTVNHLVDSCGGNSGSPIFPDSTQRAIGIHTHGGCTNPVGTSSNGGTVITHAGLQQAITAVCTPRCADECASATEIFVGVNGLFANTGATQSTPAWPCGIGPIHDCWYVFTAGCTGPVTFHTCTSTRRIDTVMRVYAAACNGTLVGCNDDMGGSCGLASAVTVNVTMGQRYFVAVGGSLGAQGEYEISVQTGSGAGSITYSNVACGPATISVSGTPRIGGTVVTNINTNQTGDYGFIGLGFGPNSTFCSCTVFGNWQSAVFGSTHNLFVPCLTAYIGAAVKIQGAFLNATGGCSSPAVVLTNGATVTIG